eukprot:TRINITY_DN20150_c0_g3_i2.p1 TRINITY_DN20150_c0_g3~~TRINITY_DN20150_c0_g3_i2.p1  ORF type:complete len:118 (-),score=7.83 TRINITY_DN20150_c0_g3_i2:27-380(-)
MGTSGTEADKGTIRSSPTSSSRTLTVLTLAGQGVGNIKPLHKEPSQVLLCTHIESPRRKYKEVLALRKAHEAREVVTHVAVHHPFTTETRYKNQCLPGGGAPGAIEVSSITLCLGRR